MFSGVVQMGVRRLAGAVFGGSDESDPYKKHVGAGSPDYELIP